MELSKELQSELDYLNIAVDLSERKLEMLKILRDSIGVVETTKEQREGLYRCSNLFINTDMLKYNDDEEEQNGRRKM